ncbi:unnamed protein product [Rotaria sordida]|uniref:N-acetyltransferase domain-containing protein n=1 Tax=Rotaria sordida TaxID=392033 RepID=A0A814D8Y6_9BILA|nr:unnamed protein product [Rotaria sordida]
MALKNMIIRSFEPDDLLHCQNITLSVYKDYGNIDDYAEKAISSDMVDIEQNYLKIPGGDWWVAVLDQQHIIGQIGIQPLSVGDQKSYRDALMNSAFSSYIDPEQICELRRLAVLSKYQRQQIGSKLLQTLIEYAKTFGYKAIHLTTLTSMLSACQFYDKHGFKRGKIEQYNLTFDSDNKVIYTKSTVFENPSALTDDDRHLISQPMYEIHRIYVQHYWMLIN